MRSSDIPGVLKPATLAALLALACVGTARAETRVADPSEAAPSSSTGLEIQSNIETLQVEVAINGALALMSDSAFAEVSIANPAIADIVMTSSSTLNILGRRAGRTTLMLMDDAGQVGTIVDILVSPDIAELKARLEDILPGEDIRAHTANDGIVLSGTVSTAERMNMAVELAGHYAPDKVSNLMVLKPAEEAAPDLTALNAGLAALLPGEAITATMAGPDLVLSGEASSDAALATARDLAGRFAPGRVLSLVTVARPDAPTPDAEAVAAQLKQILPGESVAVHAMGGTLVLSGQASSETARNQALEVARLAAPGIPISNLMTVAETRICTIKTQRGSEIVEVTTPCRDPS